MSESIDIRELNARIEQQSAFVTNITAGMSHVIVGQQHLVESLLIGLLSDGHVLLEGVPGLAKTLAISTLSKLVDADFNRIQFTPDLLPADVVGTMIYSQKEERFLVMATQNPIEQEGTYPLPEAQVDRFMLKVIIDYPTIEEEKRIIRGNLAGERTEVYPVTDAQQILHARSVVEEVYIDEKIEQYIADLVFATRYPDRYKLSSLHQYIQFGGSPRASISLAKAARAYAFIKRRGYVVPEDVRAVAHDVLRHRIGLTYEAEAANVTTEDIISQVINKVEVP